MKIIYELNTQDPDQREEIVRMHHAHDYYFILWEIDQKIRDWQKHENAPTLEKADKLLDQVRRMSQQCGED